MLPISFLVVFQQLFGHLLHTDEPRRNSAVDKGCFRAPAERIAVLYGAGIHQSATVFQHFDNVLVCIFDVLAGEISNWINESSSIIHRTNHLLIS